MGKISNKNILFLDFETTGLKINKDEIVSIYAQLDTSVINTLVKPGIPIPEEVSNIHGISNEDVKYSPTIKEMLTHFSILFNRAKYICGYNIMRFDIPLLVDICKRYNIELDIDKEYIDVYYMYKTLCEDLVNDKSFKFNLSNIYKEVIGKEFHAHNAENDVIATIELFNYVGKRSLEYVMDKQDLSGQPITDLDYVLKFGKHKGSTIEDVITNHKGYIKYCLKRNIISLDKKALDEYEKGV